MTQIKKLTQGRECGKTLLLVQIAFLLLPEHQKPKNLASQKRKKKKGQVNSQLDCLANILAIEGFTITPGDEACIMSGLNRAISEMILGLSASERGTFW